jgi:hypothetical protein
MALHLRKTKCHHCNCLNELSFEERHFVLGARIISLLIIFGSSIGVFLKTLTIGGAVRNLPVTTIASEFFWNIVIFGGLFGALLGAPAAILLSMPLQQYFDDEFKKRSFAKAKVLKSDNVIRLHSKEKSLSEIVTPRKTAKIRRQVAEKSDLEFDALPPINFDL